MYFYGNAKEINISKKHKEWKSGILNFSQWFGGTGNLVIGKVLKTIKFLKRVWLWLPASDVTAVWSISSLIHIVYEAHFMYAWAFYSLL